MSTCLHPITLSNLIAEITMFSSFVPLSLSLTTVTTIVFLFMWIVWLQLAIVTFSCTHTHMLLSFGCSCLSVVPFLGTPFICFFSLFLLLLLSFICCCRCSPTDRQITHQFNRGNVFRQPKPATFHRCTVVCHRAVHPMSAHTLTWMTLFFCRCCSSPVSVTAATTPTSDNPKRH